MGICVKNMFTRKGISVTPFLRSDITWIKQYLKEKYMKKCWNGKKCVVAQIKDKYIVHTKDYKWEKGIHYLPVYMMPFL